jgi:hypothetical protein
MAEAGKYTQVAARHNDTLELRSSSRGKSCPGTHHLLIAHGWRTRKDRRTVFGGPNRRVSFPEK